MKMWWEQTALEQCTVATVHQDNWFVYHDTHALMTAKHTVKWMINPTTLLIMERSTLAAGFCPVNKNLGVLRLQQ
jgi:hypothetical protein